MEYEFTADGHLVLSAHEIHKARQAFLDGDLGPLLALQRYCTSYCLTIAPSPHLSQLLIDILTETIKRPNRRPKQPLMSHNEIVRIGTLVRDLTRKSDPNRMKRGHGAMDLVAEGIPALKDSNGDEIPDEYYLPPIPISRVRKAWAAFLKLQGEPRPWDGQPCIPWEAKTTRNPKKKPATTKSSQPKQSSRTTRSPHTTHSTRKP